eukprot:3217243-Lingulodinium_polyedra.AAC.1
MARAGGPYFCVAPIELDEEIAARRCVQELPRARGRWSGPLFGDMGRVGRLMHACAGPARAPATMADGEAVLIVGGVRPACGFRCASRTRGKQPRGIVFEWRYACPKTGAGRSEHCTGIFCSAMFVDGGRSAPPPRVCLMP